MSVAGDWAFIPGAWKAIGDEDPARGIPTTYYAAVQVTRRLRGPVASRKRSRRCCATQLGLLDPDGEYVDPSEHASPAAGDSRRAAHDRGRAGEVQVRRQRRRRPTATRSPSTSRLGTGPATRPRSSSSAAPVGRHGTRVDLIP